MPRLLFGQIRGTASVTLQASPNPANLVFSTVGPFSLTTVPTVYATVHSQLQSTSRGDTTIQVLEGMAVAASLHRHLHQASPGEFQRAVRSAICHRRRAPLWQSDLPTRQPHGPETWLSTLSGGADIWARRRTEFRAHYWHCAHQPRNDRHGAECTPEQSGGAALTRGGCRLHSRLHQRRHGHHHW